MRADWLDDSSMGHVLAALTQANRLAIETSIRYGLRIGDVLGLTRKQVAQGRFTIHEQKTGKSRRVTIPKQFGRLLLSQAGRYFIFEGRCDENKPRTRQAVWRDVKRATKAFRISGNISPHSARKIYAVHLMERYNNDVKRVQKALNHSSVEVTMIYAMADKLRKQKSKRGRA